MNIGIIGLGLIGGSMAKAIKAYRNDVIFGADHNEDVIVQAMSDGVIAGKLNEETIPKCDFIFIAIYPEAAVAYLTSIAPQIRKETVVVDGCGVKRFVCDAMRPVSEAYGFTFIGGHPMAGMEVAGYENATPTLYRGASMILTPYAETPRYAVDRVGEFFLTLGFGHIEVNTAKRHDRNIAYTSQLAHVVSNAYVKSPGAVIHRGFSAGSFKDLTRVARLEETMWTELFLKNGDYLVKEIETIIGHLQEYADAIKKNQTETLCRLLKEGRERKEMVDPL